MKRFWILVALMMLGSSADARDSFSFTVGGHRIRIEASRHCNSASCVSVSMPGIHPLHRGRNRYGDDDDREVAEPAQPPVAAVAHPPLPATAAVKPVVVPPPAAGFTPAAVVSQQVTSSPRPQIQPLQIVATPPVERAEIVPNPDPAPQPSRASFEADEPADTPLGDWQTEGNKGSVRIQRCGRALCGYLLNRSSDGNGEAVLINMKPKADSQWSGNVYSHDSGDTYYGTMAMTGPNALRVEACALGRFYCSGNLWTRIGGGSETLITSRRSVPEPRS